jgi:Zn-dependent peptidase ImmA (M78 family)
VNLSSTNARTDAAPAPPVDPIAAARAVLARFDIRSPREIKIELIAYHLGAIVVGRDTGSADARVVRSGTRAFFAIAKEAIRTPRGRFSTAHETGHHQLHLDYDAIARIHGAARTSSREFKVELEADRFASEILVPTMFAMPMCALVTPTLEAVGCFAREFEVSLTVGAKKWASLAQTGCAFVESRGDRIKRVVRSSGFRGVAVERRLLEEGTLALEMGRTNGEGGMRVHSSASQKWGSLLAGTDVIEECVPLGEGGKVLTWLWHE